MGEAACPCCTQLGPDVPLSSPADQVPDKALSERSQLEKVTSRSPLSSTETPITKEMPSLKAKGSRLQNVLVDLGVQGFASPDGLPALASRQAPPRPELQGQTPQEGARDMKYRAPRQMGEGEVTLGTGLGVAVPATAEPSEQAGQRGGRAGSRENAWAPSVGGTRWRWHSTPGIHFRSFSSGTETRESVKMCDEITCPEWPLLTFPPSSSPVTALLAHSIT